MPGPSWNGYGRRRGSSPGLLARTEQSSSMTPAETHRSARYCPRMGWKRQLSDAANIVVLTAMAVYLVLQGLWPFALLCAIGIGATVVTFGKPHAKFDPSKSWIQGWNERRRS
jgi:hypothetical protein